MSDLLRTFPDKDGHYRPAVWTDKQGITHRVVGADVHRGVRLLWPLCGKGDVPANAAWIERAEDEIDCPQCRATP